MSSSRSASYSAEVSAVCGTRDRWLDRQRRGDDRLVARGIRDARSRGVLHLLLDHRGTDRAGRARDRAHRLVRSNVQRLPMPQTGLALNRQWAGARSSASRTARRRVVGVNGFSRNPARLPDGTRSATAASAKPDTPCSARRAARASVAHRRSAAPYRGFSRAKRRVSCRARSSTAGAAWTPARLHPLPTRESRDASSEACAGSRPAPVGAGEGASGRAPRRRHGRRAAGAGGNSAG
jgi:hypothetical protein